MRFQKKKIVNYLRFQAERSNFSIYLFSILSAVWEKRGEYQFREVVMCVWCRYRLIFLVVSCFFTRTDIRDLESQICLHILECVVYFKMIDEWTITYCCFFCQTRKLRFVIHNGFKAKILQYKAKIFVWQALHFETNR